MKRPTTEVGGALDRQGADIVQFITFYIPANCTNLPRYVDNMNCSAGFRGGSGVGVLRAKYFNVTGKCRKSHVKCQKQTPLVDLNTPSRNPGFAPQLDVSKSPRMREIRQT